MGGLASTPLKQHSSFQGVRTFTLVESTDGFTTLGMIEGSLPNFTQSFETFAADLKKQAEAKAPPPEADEPAEAP